MADFFIRVECPGTPAILDKVMDFYTGRCNFKLLHDTFLLLSLEFCYKAKYYMEATEFSGFLF